MLASGTRGVIASGSRLAAAAGMDVFEDGGAAVDAVIAAAAVEWVALPWSTGIGGDSFCIVREGSTGRLTALAGCGRSPTGLDLARLRSASLDRLPARGGLSVCVPGSPDALWRLHQRFGTLPMRRLVAPAIGLASDGFAVDERAARFLRVARRQLTEGSAAADVFAKGDSPYAVGDVLRQPNLAETLDTFAATGPDGIYRGGIARRIVDAARSAGSPLGEADLAAHAGALVPPLSARIRDVDVVASPPPSQGLTLLQSLAISTRLPRLGDGSLDADRVHALVEAARAAFGRRVRVLADPDHVAVDTAAELSGSVVGSLAATISPDRAGHWDLAQVVGGDTTCTTAADARGNVVSLVHSIGALWGSGVMAPGTGILLNNRAARGFYSSPGLPATLVGGRRPMHTLHCWLIVRPSGEVIAGGTPGGDLGLQWSAQSALALVADGESAESVVELPRFHGFPGADPAHVGLASELQLEDRFPTETIDSLRSRGHRVRTLPAWGTDSALQIAISDVRRGRVSGASDPRAGGAALAS